MGLFGLFERRASLESPSRPLTSSALLEWFEGPVNTDSGQRVTEVSAMSVSAVYRAVSLISGLAASLPLHAYAQGTRERVPALLVDNPHPTMTAYEFWRLSFVHRLLWGNFVAQKVRFPRSRRIHYLHPIAPERVNYGKAEPIPENPTGLVYEITREDGTQVVLTPNEVFHLPGLGFDGVAGVSPIRLAAQGIGLSLAAERYGARLFGSGNLLSGILKTTQRLDQSQAEALQRRWKQKMGGLQGAHEVAVLDSGAEFQSLTMPNDEAQLLESRRFQVTEIARIYGVPPFMLMETERSTSWGTGLEQQALGFVMFDLHPLWLAPTEQRVTRDLLQPGYYAKYTVEGLLRGDSQARAAFYTAMRNLGVYSANDIRELEEKPPIPAEKGGDDLLVPLNMGPLRSPGTANQTGTAGGQREGGSNAPQPAE